MESTITIPSKYIFLDIVKYTQNRSVEAQTEIIGVLNEVVGKALEKNEVTKEKLILLPTGDGLCIVLLNLEEPYDIHIKIALDILDILEVYNSNTEDKMRQFAVRIGINANIDNLVLDINGNRNIAGAGINLCQRIMSVADGNQIMVGQAVYEVLTHREKYMKSFKSYTSKVKHGVSLPIYQLLKEGISGLNTNIPSAFYTPPSAPLKLSKFMAYYFAHTIKNFEFLSKNSIGQGYYSGIILLWFLARDSVNKSESSLTDAFFPETPRAESGSFIEQFSYFNNLIFSVCSQFALILIEKDINRYNNYFETDKYNMSCPNFINDKGREKLKLEWPEIWNEFNLDEI